MSAAMYDVDEQGYTAAGRALVDAWDATVEPHHVPAAPGPYGDPWQTAPRDPDRRAATSRMEKAAEVVEQVVYDGWTADEALARLRSFGLLDDEVTLNNATEAMRLRDEARDDPAALRHDLRPGADVKAYAEVVQAAQECHLQDALEVIAGVTP